MTETRIIVAGRVHMELSVDRQRRRTGEEERLRWHHGGVGGHLAAAAARLGASVALLAAAGLSEDDSGLLAELARDGVDTACVARRTPLRYAPHIGLERHGNDQPVALCATTPSSLCSADLDAAEPLFLQHNWLMLDAGLPLEIITEIIERAALFGLQIVVHLARPPHETMPRRIWKDVNYLVTNQSCLDAFSRMQQWPAAVLGDGRLLCREFPGLHGLLALRGAAEMLVADRAMQQRLPLAARAVVDVRGVGAVACAALTVGLAEGQALLDAARQAHAAARFYISHEGARAAMPSRLELQALMPQHNPIGHVT